MKRLIPIVAIAFLCSCRAYKQDIMFQFDDDFSKENVSAIKKDLEGNYLLKPNDQLQLDVFTNDGERLIDPNNEILSISGGGQAGLQQQQQREKFQYVIQGDGIVTFPLIGNINLVGMTLYDAELKVAMEFEKFYEDPFVKLRIRNRRVFVLGAPGGQVVPLENENTGVVEVIASTQGIDRFAKADNIRVIRGDEVFLVDLSTISGMRDTNITVEPGDVIYIEPWRRPWLESVRDASPLISIISSAITLMLVIRTL